MSSPSPIVTVKDGAGSPQSTTSGAVDVTAGNTITIALADTTGVRTWSVTLFGQDELVTPPTVTVNQVTKTATFTAPALPWSLVYESTVNSGVDVNGVTQDSYSTTFKICCLTAGGKRLLATNETVENSTSYGWMPILNDPIRNPPIASTPTGSGFRHVTAGAEDGTASKGTAAQIIVTNAGASDAVWVTVSGDLTLAASGAVTVAKVNGTSVPAGGALTTGNGLYVTGVGALSYSALNLAGGANYVTGTLPAGNQAAQTMGGDVGGTTAASVVNTLTGTGNAVTVPAATSIRFGAVPSTTGTIRFSSNGAVIARRSDNGGDLNLCALISDVVTLGDTNRIYNTVLNAGILSIVANNYRQTTAPILYEDTTTINWRPGGTQAIAWNLVAAGTTNCRYANTVTAATYNFADKTTNSGTGGSFSITAQNETGTTSTGGALNLSSGTGTSAYGEVNLVGPTNIGFFTQAMADAPQTISAANSKNNIIQTTGANTVVRALTLSRPPTAGAMVIVRNDCTVSGITVQFSSGAATGTILPGTSALICGDGTNAFIAIVGA